MELVARLLLKRDLSGRVQLVDIAAVACLELIVCIHFKHFQAQYQVR